MTIHITSGPEELGELAASIVAAKLTGAIQKRGEARLLLATGASQRETLQCLVRSQVDWGCVTVFHLDEYINLPESHPASFRKYLKDRFLNQVAVKRFYPVNTEGDVSAGIQRLTEEVRKSPIDAGLIGIGENAHIAFNDPPADFSTREAYIRVKLDEKCKNQQVGEGWFGNIQEVPAEALSMTVYQIMQCRAIISAVPHGVKAEAVYRTLTNGLTKEVPATMLKMHGDYCLILDRDSSSRVINLPLTLDEAK